jgi:xanthine dehydrogenase iron-sulfur cluster and FAD-binding subunit A
MKLKLFTASILSLMMLFSIQLGHAVVVKTDLPKTGVKAVENKTSPIEKAIQQQKSEKTLNTEDNLKVLTALKVAPSQNFFAAQNYRFTRFVQSIFSSDPS